MDKENFKTAKEVALDLRVSRATITRLVQQNKLKHYRIGDRLIFSRKHLDDYLASVERPTRAKTRARTREVECTT